MSPSLVRSGEDHGVREFAALAEDPKEAEYEWWAGCLRPAGLFVDAYLAGTAHEHAGFINAYKAGQPSSPAEGLFREAEEIVYYEEELNDLVNEVQKGLDGLRRRCGTPRRGKFLRT